MSHTNAPQSTTLVAAQQGGRNDVPVPTGNNAAAATHISPTAASAAQLLDGLDPFELLTDEVKNSYLRCSYKWSFHHTPTLLLRIRDRTLEPWMAWAMLALAIRYDSSHSLPCSAPDTHLVQIRQRPPAALPLPD